MLTLILDPWIRSSINMFSLMTSSQITDVTSLVLVSSQDLHYSFQEINQQILLFICSWFPDLCPLLPHRDTVAFTAWLRSWIFFGSASNNGNWLIMIDTIDWHTQKGIIPCHILKNPIPQEFPELVSSDQKNAHDLFETAVPKSLQAFLKLFTCRPI